MAAHRQNGSTLTDIKKLLMYIISIKYTLVDSAHGVVVVERIKVQFIVRVS